MNTLSEEIKRLRQQREMTQQDLADFLFVTRQAISNYENGKTTPDIQTLQKLGEIFNTDLIRYYQKAKPLKNYSAMIYMVIILFTVIHGIIRWNLGLSLIDGQVLNYVLVLMSTTLYFAFNYMIKNDDYSLMAGYDSTLPYHYPTLKKMVSNMLHMVLLDILGYLIILTMISYLNVDPLVFPFLFIAFIFTFICSIMLVNYRYKDQLLLKKVSRPGSNILVLIFLVAIFALIIEMILVMTHFKIANNTPEALQLLLILFPYLILNVVWLLITDSKIKNAKDNIYPYKKSALIVILIDIALLIGLYLLASNF